MAVWDQVSRGAKNFIGQALLGDLVNITPGDPPEKMMWGRCQAGSSAIFLRTKKQRWSLRRAMKAVPGVMQFESNAFGSTASPFRSACAAFCSRDATCLNTG